MATATVTREGCLVALDALDLVNLQGIPQVFRYLIHLFTTPSAYIDDWRGYLINQLGHAAIGLVAAHFLGAWALVAYAAWEVAQYRQSRNKSLWRGSQLRVGATISDCLEDFQFVAFGVFAVLITPWFLAMSALSLIIGTLARTGH